MKFESIDEIYVANSNVRKKLLDLIAGLSAEDGDLPTENGKWTVSKIVEHLSKVEDSMMRICRKLLTKAKEKGLAADRSVKISEHFIDSLRGVVSEGTRLEAPAIVQPEGGQSFAESVVMLESTRKELERMRGMFDEWDSTAFSFPHPAFGALTALDWLVLIGGHESRHVAQIERILARKNAAKA